MTAEQPLRRSDEARFRAGDALRGLGCGDARGCFLQRPGEPERITGLRDQSGASGRTRPPGLH